MASALSMNPSLLGLLGGLGGATGAAGSMDLLNQLGADNTSGGESSFTLGDRGIDPTTMELMKAGSILSGFGAGVAGKANPAVEQITELMKTFALSNYRQRILAETQRHHAKLEENQKIDNDLALRKFEAQVAHDQISTGIPEQIEQGFRRQMKLGLLPGTTEEDIKKATTDVIWRERIKNRAKETVAMIAAGVDIGIPIPPEYTALKDRDPDKLAEIGGFKTALEASVHAKKLLEDKAEIELRTKLLDPNYAPSPRELLYLNKGKLPSKDELILLGRQTRDEGKPLDPFLQKLVEEDARLKAVELRSKDADSRSKEIDTKIKQLKLEGKNDPISTIGKLGAEIKRTTEVLNELSLAMDIPEAQRSRLLEETKLSLLRLQSLKQTLEREQIAKQQSNKTPLGSVRDKLNMGQ